MRGESRPQGVLDLKPPAVIATAGRYACPLCCDRGLIRTAGKPQPAIEGLTAKQLLTEHVPCTCKMGAWMGSTGREMAAEWAKPIFNRDGSVIVPALITGWSRL